MWRARPGQQLPYPQPLPASVLCLARGTAQVPRRMSLLSRGIHRGCRAPSLLISTESRPLNWTQTHGETLTLLHSLGNTGSVGWGGKQTDLFLSGIGHSWVFWHFTRAVNTLVPILQTGKLRQQLLSDLSNYCSATRPEQPSFPAPRPVTRPEQPLLSVQGW